MGNTQGKSTPYSMLIEWSNTGNCFVVTVPELPGCMGDGETREEAIKMGEEAIKEWVDTAKERNRQIPEPHICTVVG